MKKRIYSSIIAYSCILSLTGCGNMNDTTSLQPNAEVSTPLHTQTQKENIVLPTITVKEVFELNEKGNSITLSDFQLFIDYATQDDIYNRIKIALAYRNTDYELQIKYNTIDNTLSEVLLIYLATGESIDIRTNSVEEFFNKNTDMKNYLTYKLPSELKDNEYDPQLDGLGGNTFISDSLNNSKLEDVGDDIPNGWTALGGVEMYYKNNYLFENGILKDVTLPWNHSTFINDVEPVEGCETQAILRSVSHDLNTGADITNAEPTTSEYWYVFFAKENSDISYVLYLNQEFFSKDDLIALAQTVKFSEDAFNISIS